MIFVPKKNATMVKIAEIQRKIKEDNYEAMCNPIMQAKVLKEKDTEINIVVGLCIGHDILFNKHSHVVTTTLIVKDRILAHNPIGALYSPYYSNKFRPVQ